MSEQRVRKCAISVRQIHGSSYSSPRACLMLALGIRSGGYITHHVPSKMAAFDRFKFDKMSYTMMDLCEYATALRWYPELFLTVRFRRGSLWRTK